MYEEGSSTLKDLPEESDEEPPLQAGRSPMQCANLPNIKHLDKDSQVIMLERLIQALLSQIEQQKSKFKGIRVIHEV